MTKQEAYALIADLTPAEKRLLDELLLTLRRNPSPAKSSAEARQEKGNTSDAYR